MPLLAGARAPWVLPGAGGPHRGPRHLPAQSAEQISRARESLSPAVCWAPEARRAGAGRSRLCGAFTKSDLEMNSPVRGWLPRYRGEGA